jgi:hypothetical protein
VFVSREGQWRSVSHIVQTWQGLHFQASAGIAWVKTRAFQQFGDSNLKVSSPNEFQRPGLCLQWSGP